MSILPNVYYNEISIKVRLALKAVLSGDFIIKILSFL